MSFFIGYCCLLSETKAIGYIGFAKNVKFCGKDKKKRELLQTKVPKSFKLYQIAHLGNE